MTSQRKLPDEAHKALAGLKGQVEASSPLIKAFSEGISEAESKARLREAQKQIAADADWTKEIVRRIFGPVSKVNIDGIHKTWLNKTFA
jgi:hypothetical protein